MAAVIVTYVRQRFGLAQVSVALFLLLFANGARWTWQSAHWAPLYAMALVLWFRLFDDLASRDIDSGKDRIHTRPEAQSALRATLGVLGALLLALTALRDARAGLLLGALMLVCVAAYRHLFDRGRWRTVLPLTKYPVLALLLMLPVEPIAVERVLACLALLPMFLLFESLDDDEFRVPGIVAALLLVAAHGLLAPALGWVIPCVGAAIALTVGTLGHRWEIPALPYAMMLYFLTLRLVAIDRV